MLQAHCIPFVVFHQGLPGLDAWLQTAAAEAWRRSSLLQPSYPQFYRNRECYFRGRKRPILVVGRPRSLRAGLFDVAKERARLAKQREKLAKELAAVAARVSNEAFISRAPPRVVAEVRLGVPDEGRGFHVYGRLNIQGWREL